MTQRYVRVKSSRGLILYGSLQLDRSVTVFSAAPWLGGTLTSEELEPDTYQILAPCLPSKIIAVGKNYRAHAEEMGSSVPDEPLLFLKPPTTIIANGQPVLYPPQSKRVDYEGELALVIGESARNCTVTQARGKIWGYTIANDVTARDLQRQDNQWTRAKGFDSFCPLGPWIVRELSIGAKLTTFINDSAEPRQSAYLGDMVFPPDFLVSYISGVMTLYPGDVILTGTPEGIGPVKVGDSMRVQIEGIGSLENSVIQGDPLPPPPTKPPLDL